MAEPLTPENRAGSIEYLRGELRLDIAAAIQSIDRISRDLDDLTRNDLYDVEYAEGQSTHHMRAFLADARRLLVAVQALNPCGGEA